MTLSTLRTLPALANGRAVDRLPDRGVEAVARAYLPRTIWLDYGVEGVNAFSESLIGLIRFNSRMDAPLDTSDPGTVNAIKTALALALGLDPGPMGLAVSWQREGECWTLAAMDCRQVTFEPEDSTYGIRAGNVQTACITWRCVPEVATEPEPIKALVLACEHVIKERT